MESGEKRETSTSTSTGTSSGTGTSTSTGTGATTSTVTADTGLAMERSGGLFGAAWKKIVSRPDPLSGIALTLPVFLVYHLGILVVPERTFSDWVSSFVFLLLEASVSGYVIVTLGFALALSVAVWVQQKRGAVQSWAIGRVLLESALLGLLLVVTLGWATYKLSGGVTLAAPKALSTLTRVVLACGAGFHEELLFRAILISAGSAGLVKLFQMQRAAAMVTMLIASSILFGLAQYVGPLGDSFAFDTLAYRTLLGAALGVIFVLRGFALAVYTHVMFSALVYFVYA